MASDILDVFGIRYTNVAGIKATDSTSSVRSYIRPEGTYSINANGTFDIASYMSVSVNVQGGPTVNNQDKTVTPTESLQSVTFDAASGYTGLGTVTVNAISSNYVGTAIPVRSALDVQVTGPSVNGYSGYYSEAFSKTVETMTLPTVTNNLSIGAAKATIAFSTALRYLDIPKGFNSASAFYTLESVPTMTLPTATAATSTGTNKATIERNTAIRYLNIPTGYNSASVFYTIASIPNGTAYPPATITGSSATVTAGTNVIFLRELLAMLL